MDKINNIGLSRMLTSAYDFDGFTSNEVWSRIAQKINIIIEHFNYIDKKIDNEKENNKAKFDYLLGEGLTEQVAKALLEKINDGTLGDLINGTLLKDINDKVDSEVQSINEQLDTIIHGDFFEFLKTANSLVLIGDSITEGTGASGHDTPSGNRVTFNNGNEIFYEGDYTCRCWANLFREYVKTINPSLEFFNKGIGGKSAKWANEIVNGKKNIEYWLPNVVDIGFVQLGTNDRMYSDNIADYKTQITNVLSYVKSKCKYMIVMSATPCNNDYNTDGSLAYRFNMWDIDRVLREVCKENNYFFISNYEALIQFATTSGMDYTYLLEVTGSHPTDSGHMVIWNNIKDNLKFTEKLTKNNFPKFTQLILDYVNNETTIDKFPFGLSYCQISSNNATGLPFNMGGTLLTYRDEINVSFVYQEFMSAGYQQMIYRRTIQNGKWTEWKLASFNEFPINYSRNKTIDNFPIGVTYSVEISDTGNGFPNDSGGLCITYNPYGNNSVFSYQVFNVAGTNKTYRRYCNNNIWSEWVNLEKPIIKTYSYNFNNVDSMKVAGGVIDIPYAKLEEYSYIVSPKSVLDTNIFFSYSVLGTGLYIRLFNASSNQISLGTLEFDLTMMPR